MANQQQDKAKDHKNISFTADYHPFFKKFYGIPYAQEIFDFVSSQPGIDARGDANIALIPVFEARGKGTDAAMRKYLESQGVRQVLSLAAGMEQRGIAMTSEYPDMIYVETDISDIFQKKAGLADTIFAKYNLPNRRGLHFQIADATNPEQITEVTKKFSPDKPIIIVNEGLLAYYSEEENRAMARNNRTLLEKFGGFWVTSDPSMNHANRRILLSHVTNMNAAQAKIGQKTGRPYDKNGFRDNEHAERVFAEEGLKVTRFGHDDLGYVLNSFDKVGLDSETARQVAENIRKYSQAWVMTPK